MNPRERVLALGVALAVILAGGIFLVVTFYITPLRNRQASLRSIQEEIDHKEETIRQILAQKPKLERWRQLSLPADIDLAKREYATYLEALLRQSGFAARNFSVTPKPTDSKASPSLPGRGPIFTRLDYNVTAHGSLECLVQALAEFYRTGLLHQIRSLAINRPLTVGPQQEPNDLDISFTVEALAVSGAGNREYLLPNVSPRLVLLDALTSLLGGPPGFALAGWAAGPSGPNGPSSLAEPERNYSAIASKNIFLGNQSSDGVARGWPDVTAFVLLTDITHNERRWEAYLYDQSNNRKTRLRKEAGFDSFRILDNKGEPLVRGKVVRIEPRELVFQVGDKYFGLHVGQTIEDSMKRPLTADQLSSLGLTRTSSESSSLP